MVTATVLISLLLLTGLASWLGWLGLRSQEQFTRQLDLQRSDLLAIIRKKEEQIDHADAEYKALAESYIRETGKVYIRPVPQTPDRLSPPEPNPFRMKAPPWANPNNKEKING